MQKSLSSSINRSAKNCDPKLISPFVVLDEGGYLWVSINSSSLVSKYTHKGVLKGSITIENPTGMTYIKDKYHKSGMLYVATSTGKIYKVAPDSTTPTLVATPTGNLQAIAYYKGNLYVTVKSQVYIKSYDLNGAEVSSLTDADLKDFGYYPYGLYANKKNLYVTYSSYADSVGNGYVNVYNKCDGFYRLINRGPLVNPYGLAVVEDYLYIGNRSNGQISIYRCDGTYVKQLANEEGGILVNENLMGITYSCGKLYYVSDVDRGSAGVLGVIVLNV
jgi:hypothetical protein